MNCVHRVYRVITLITPHRSHEGDDYDGNESEILLRVRERVIEVILGMIDYHSNPSEGDEGENTIEGKCLKEITH